MRKLKTTELNRVSIDEFKQLHKTPVTVVLDNVRSMLNVGSVFRTCDAFRVGRLILCGITAKPPHREITKSALGSTESVDWEYAESAQQAIEKLKESGKTIIVVEQTNKSVSIDQFMLKQDQEYALVFGNEVEGVSDKVIDQADFALEIPQFGTKHSLNISVSAGIVIWHFASKLIAVPDKTDKD